MKKKINEKKGITTIKIHYTNACSELIVEEIKNIPEGNYIFFERDEGYKYNKNIHYVIFFSKGDIKYYMIHPNVLFYDNFSQTSMEEHPEKVLEKE